MSEYHAHCLRKVYRRHLQADDWCARPIWKDSLCGLHHPERRKARRLRRNAK